MSPSSFPTGPRDLHQHRLGAVFGSLFQDVSPGIGPAHEGGHLLELLGLPCKDQRILSVGNEFWVHECKLRLAEAARVIWITSGPDWLYKGPRKSCALEFQRVDLCPLGHFRSVGALADKHVSVGERLLCA